MLTICLAVTDSQLQVLEKLSFCFKPEDNIYKVTAEALEINKIDLKDHHGRALAYKEVRPKIMNFLTRHSDMGMNKLIPAGHNIAAFDELFVQHYIMTKEEWESVVDYHRLDTAPIVEFLKFIGKVPNSVPSSLKRIANFFGVNTIGNHNAERDVEITIELLRAMKLVMRT